MACNGGRMKNIIHKDKEQQADQGEGKNLWIHVSKDPMFLCCVGAGLDFSSIVFAAQTWLVTMEYIFLVFYLLYS